MSFDSPGYDWEWLPVTLTDAESELLSRRSDPPKTALDFYLNLSGGYFGRNIHHETERRITFIDRETLSDRYLHASYTIPSVDAGSFSITIRLFGDKHDPLIAISHLKSTRRLFAAKENNPKGLWSIQLNKPAFWRYRGGAFAEGGAMIRVTDSILPELPVERILDRYRNHYKAHLNHPTQKKSIYLTYELPQDGKIVQVTGGENFMRSRKETVWAEFVYDGELFVPSTPSEQDAALTNPRSAMELKSDGS
ncbi:MAG: hypothetical protein ACR2RV_25705 [Verrucomicrobiales bacterium]